MFLHYLIIVFCLVVVLSFQVIVFLRTKKKSAEFDNVFPENIEKEWVIFKDESKRRKGGEKRMAQIVSKKLLDAQDMLNAEKKRLESINNDLQKQSAELQYNENALQKAKELQAFQYVVANDSDVHLFQQKVDSARKNLNNLDNDRKKSKSRIANLERNIKVLEQKGNDVRTIIIDSINRYLDRNKHSVTDFNLIKDIIDRNCGAIEEEVQTQVPMPLYLGLMGTMFGILVGVVALVASGSLESLLSTFSPPIGAEEGSFVYNRAKVAFEETAARGVSDLLGGVAMAMVASIVGVLLTTIGSWNVKSIKARVENKKHAFISWLQAELLPKISSDLSSAIVRLGQDLSGFNNTFSNNAEKLNTTISKVNDATNYQVKLYDKLENLDIKRFAEANVQIYDNLKNCTQDLADLSNNLHNIQQEISSLSATIDNGVRQYDDREKYIQNIAAKVDGAVKDGCKNIEDMATSAQNGYNNLINKLFLSSMETTEDLAKKYDKQVESLHRAIVDKLTDMKQLEKELQNLVDVKNSMSNLEKATQEQNKKLDGLINSIRELAQVKTIGGTPSLSLNFPKTYKMLIVVAGSTIIIIGVLLFISMILNFIELPLGGEFFG